MHTAKCILPAKTLRQHDNAKCAVYFLHMSPSLVRGERVEFMYGWFGFRCVCRALLYLWYNDLFEWRFQSTFNQKVCNHCFEWRVCKGTLVDFEIQLKMAVGAFETGTILSHFVHEIILNVVLNHKMSRKSFQRNSSAWRSWTMLFVMFCGSRCI